MNGPMFRLETAHVARRVHNVYIKTEEAEYNVGASAFLVRKWNTTRVSRTEPLELKDFSYLLV